MGCADLIMEIAESLNAKADELWEFGAEEGARALRAAATLVTQRGSDWLNEPLTLEQAANESGYSADHLGRLVRDGTIPNAGQPYAPRIIRSDVPNRPAHQLAQSRETALDSSRLEMARSVVASC